MSKFKFVKKNDTHLILKVADLNKHLTTTARTHLDATLRKIDKDVGKRSYYVVNTDEPYAGKILKVIKRGEKRKFKEARIQAKFDRKQDKKQDKRPYQK